MSKYTGNIFKSFNKTMILPLIALAALFIVVAGFFLWKADINNKFKDYKYKEAIAEASSLSKISFGIFDGKKYIKNLMEVNNISAIVDNEPISKSVLDNTSKVMFTDSGVNDKSVVLDKLVDDYVVKTSYEGLEIASLSTSAFTSNEMKTFIGSNGGEDGLRKMTQDKYGLDSYVYLTDIFTLNYIVDNFKKENGLDGLGLASWIELRKKSIVIVR